MHNLDAKKIEAVYQEIYESIDHAIKNGFITDRVYEKLKIDMAVFDQLFLQNSNSPNSQQRLSELKNKIYHIYEVLNKEHPIVDNPGCLGKDRLVGDYVSDDNTFVLSEKIKSELAQILKS